jgi:uncharacterized circularly permuted ATP-grasp superfamily protein/uncharacterized alpha-E superfamily protein
MVDGRGRVRPHWRRVLAALADLPGQEDRLPGSGGIGEAARRLDRAVLEDGVSALLPGTAPGASAWRCDPVPLPIAAAEFATLSAGLAQRARLLEAILADLYGGQRLLAEGLIPPALIFANPVFLRACRSATRPPNLPLLQTYAADLLRGPDGAWRVLADRTSRAAGIGHAQENRRLLARILPEIFRGQAVRPLRPFFDLWQDALQRLAPPGRDNPAIALLTPGVHHPLWSEHVLLARELSCALVEPGDLTVRGGAVFLKTLKGLRPVDVLLRRMDGRSLDPLELPGADGVPGLIDAARHGLLRIVNAPGCGWAEAPALATLLPALCRRLLGEDLLLDSVESLWLSRPGALARVLADLPGWIIRPAFDGAARAEHPEGMEAPARTALAARIQARPGDYTATRNLAPSEAPCADGDALAPRPVVLRLFLMQDGRDWHAMPGGLARIPAPGALTGRLPQQGLSKDVWVVSEEGTAIQGPAAQPMPPLPIRRATGEMPSRVADNLFWLGRYLERLELAARLMRAALARMDRGPLLPREAAELALLFTCLKHAGLLLPEDAPNGAADTAMQEALWRAVKPGGTARRLLESVARLVESLRDRLTGDMYSVFTLPLRAVRVQAAAHHRGLQGLEETLGGVLRYCAGVAGVAAENMNRAGGFTFLDLGRRVERAQGIAAQLGFTLAQPPSHIEGGLRLALELCDSVITYRSRYLGVLQPAPALDLVLADPGNPRGLAFQLHAIRRLLQDVDGDAAAELLPPTLSLIAATDAMPQQVLNARDQPAAAALLAPRLAAMEAEIATLSDAITRRYFALLPALQTLDGQRLNSQSLDSESRGTPLLEPRPALAPHSA